MKTRPGTPDRHIGVRTRRGIATIEFVICAPVLLFLMLATAEVGRLLYQYNTLMKAARDGARYVAAHASDNGTRVVSISTQVSNETRNLVVTGNIAGTGTPVLPGLSIDQVDVEVDEPSNGFVRVVVDDYLYIPILGATLPTFGLGDPINLSMPLRVTVVMRSLL